MEYVVRRAVQTPELRGNWDRPAWSTADVGSVDHFHPRSGTHRPRTQFKLLYDDEGLHVIFRVSDRYVLCRRIEPQSMVCNDSCVEAFFQPAPGSGYFNVEMNCGGTLLLFYVTDPARLPGGGLKAFEVVSPQLLQQVRVFHSMPKPILEEIVEPVDWTVECFIPKELFEAHVGRLPPPAERRWRGNFYKCADESSHPHWASWSPIGEGLNFHAPERFGTIRFE